jgi:hypothetical protein
MMKSAQETTIGTVRSGAAGRRRNIRWRFTAAPHVQEPGLEWEDSGDATV